MCVTRCNNTNSTGQNLSSSPSGLETKMIIFIAVDLIQVARSEHYAYIT
jgi:hypothetical protein